jgi:hypothetical protein
MISGQHTRRVWIDDAPAELSSIFLLCCYKDFAPTELTLQCFKYVI